MSETIKAVLSVVSVGGALFVLFHLFTRRPPLDTITPEKEREIHVDFDEKRDAAAKHVASLEREDMKEEWKRERK